MDHILYIFMNYHDVSWCVHWNPTNQIHWVKSTWMTSWHPDILRPWPVKSVTAWRQETSKGAWSQIAGFSWMLVENPMENPMIWDDLGWFWDDLGCPYFRVSHGFSRNDFVWNHGFWYVQTLDITQHHSLQFAGISVHGALCSFQGPNPSSSVHAVHAVHASWKKLHGKRETSALLGRLPAS